jgi:hypothetical protein
MPRDQELRTVTMKCDNGHTFPWQLCYKLHYVEGHNGPVQATLMNYEAVKCPRPDCGAMAAVDE